MAEQIATQFVTFYYQTFDSGDRASLKALYRPSSMLSFEGVQLLGVEPITEKLVELPFAKVAHKVTTLDPQPTGQGTSLLVMVTGQLIVDDSENPMHFSQTFHLVPEGESYFVQNDVFRLNYG